MVDKEGDDFKPEPVKRSSYNLEGITKVWQENRRIQFEELNQRPKVWTKKGVLEGSVAGVLLAVVCLVTRGVYDYNSQPVSQSSNPLKSLKVTTSCYKPAMSPPQNGVKVRFEGSLPEGAEPQILEVIFKGDKSERRPAVIKWDEQGFEAAVYHDSQLDGWHDQDPDGMFVVDTTTTEVDVYLTRFVSTINSVPLELDQKDLSSNNPLVVPVNGTPCA